MVTLRMLERHQKDKGSESGRGARARDANGQYPSRRIPVIIKTLLDLLDGEDLSAVVEVYRQAMTATRRFWVDEGKDEDGRCKGHWQEEPDWRTRISAANMVAAYMEGLPVQRQIQMRGDFVELQDLLKTAQRSGEARRLMNGFNSLPSVSERAE